MSLAFNDTVNRMGIIQTIERMLFPGNPGRISGNASLMKDFTAEVNLSFDPYLAVGLQASGKWQLDDSNHTDFPTIKTNLVSGQRAYTFTVDETNNLVLDIYAVFVKDQNGTYHKCDPVDQQSDSGTTSFTDGLDTVGVPYKYDKTANGIIFDYVPDYDMSEGVKVMINREMSYFLVTDTTKKPGVPGIHHEYFALRPAYNYARNNSLDSLKDIKDDMLVMEAKIQTYFGRREKDVKKKMQPRITRFK